MIKKLRRRFIGITMLAVLLVLTLIVVSINIFNVMQTNQSLDAVLSELYENSKKSEDLPDRSQNASSDFTGLNKGRPFPSHNEKELPFSTRYFTIQINETNQIVRADLSHIASVTDADLEQIRDKILNRGNKLGWCGNYRYLVAATGSGRLIVVLEATANRSSLLYIGSITLIVGLAAFCLVFLLVALMSKKATQPVSDAYDKQKQFITDASHELKTPLTVISANAEILALLYGSNEWCDGINKQLKTMRALIEQMLQMAKLDEGERRLIFAPFSVSDAVYDTAMSFEALALRQNLRFSVELQPDMVMLGDEAAIRGVVAILVDNAVKYCDEGGKITVLLEKQQKGFHRDRLLLTVRNTFTHADAVDTAHIFDRFYQADGARSGRSGYGLGLSIAKSIIELHHGTIACNLNDGGEIEFAVCLNS